MDKEYPLAF